MSNPALRKTTPAGNDMKSATQGTTLRQEGFHEVNKRRTFLQDNSWIKKHPEEQDENFGRAVLNRHNSHDALDRKTNESDEPKATISRYRSDDTLDRISDRKDAAETHKANRLDNRLTKRNLSTFRSPEATKQPGNLFSTNTTNTMASTSVTTPVKKKRQSWFPPPPPGYKATANPGASRRDPDVHPPIPPKPGSPVSSNLRQDNRTQDRDNIVKVATSPQKGDKGEELDNLIKMNKSLNRNQGLDGLFRANPQAEKTEKRAKSLENLIYVNRQTDKDGKGNQGFGNLTKVNQRTDKNEKGKQNLDGLIKVNPETTKNIKRGQSLDNLIKVTPDVNRRSQGSKDLDNLIKVIPETGKSVQRGQSLDNLIKEVPEANRTKQGNQDPDNLIKVNPSANKSSEQGVDELINVKPKAVRKTPGNQDLDKFIKVNPETLTKQRNQDLSNFIKVNPAVIRSNQSQDLDNLIKVKPSALRSTKRDQDLENLNEVNSNVSENKNGKVDGQVNGSTNALNNQSTGTTAYSHETRNNLSKSPKDVCAENISGKYIRTVYSTSDRSVIERDMCTYCRKPLGTETKMILDELQICCHSTCFKCEICKQPLENLKAGDSIWIYRQTIHCEPCYSKVVAKWIQ